MRKSVLLFGVVSWALTAGVGAETPADWAPVLAPFDSYGLPDVSTATYVNLVACWDPRVESLLTDGWETSGNAWMLEEIRDAEDRPVQARIVADGSRVFVVGAGLRSGDDDASRAKSAALEAPVSPQQILASGRWQKGDPARDARKGVEFLRSLQWEGEPTHGRYPGRLFLLAYALWRRGDQENASALLAELARREGGAAAVAREAMNLVADGEYGNVYEAFRANPDWEAYRDGIRRLLEKYPEGWNAAPVMHRLLEKVEARIAEPRPPPSTADRMSADDLRQAENMMDVRTWRGGADIYVDQPVLWIAPLGWRDGVPEPRDAEMEIRVRGLEASSFLLALMEEEDVLTEAGRVEVSKAGPYRTRFKPDDLDRPCTERQEQWRQSMIQQGFDAMERPATRGEVARRLLRDLVPEWVLGGSHRRLSKEEMIRAVREFREKHAEASEEELAVQTLPGRYSHSFNKLAVGHLMEVARRRPVPELEAFLLDEEWLVPEARESERDLAQDNKANLLKAYAAIRGEEARSLVEAYAAQARRQAEAFAALLGEGTDPRQHERAEKREQRLRGVAAELDKLPLGKTSFAAEDVPLDTLLLTDEPHGREVLEARLQAMVPADVFGTVLEIATRTNQAFARGRLALILMRRLEANPDHGLTATAHAAAWNELISDDRSGYPNRGASWISDQFLTLNERMFSASAGKTEADDRYSWQRVDVAEQAVKRLYRAHGPRGREWLRERVRQRLAGVPEAELPVYPIGVAPDENTLARLREVFRAVEGQVEAARLAAALPLPERIALTELLRREPELNARLLALANRIEAVMIDGDLGEWNRKLTAWEGKAVKAELIEELRHLAEARSLAGQTFSGKLVRRPDFGGYEVIAKAMVPVPEHYKPRKFEQRTSGYAGLVCGPGIYGAAHWRTAPPPEEHNWWAVETSGPFELAAFEEAVGQWLGAIPPASEEAFVIFETQGEKQ